MGQYSTNAVVSFPAVLCLHGTTCALHVHYVWSYDVMFVAHAFVRVSVNLRGLVQYTCSTQRTSKCY